MPVKGQGHEGLSQEVTRQVLRPDTGAPPGGCVGQLPVYLPPGHERASPRYYGACWPTSRTGLTRRRGRIDMPEWKVPGYTELKSIGSGGFGDVVLARHDASGTLVAVKYLRQDLLADPQFAEMFRGEAAVLASLDDPNVVRLYEYVEAPEGAAIVMELIGGVSLREILTYQGKTTAEAALVVLQGSLLGLAAAHRRGVVHRDYKPENVLVNGDGISKLTDFGIAARTGDRPIPAGTLAYAPPEQFGGAPASPAGDVYAATATFYECMTGRPPFTGGTTEALLAQHRSEPVPLAAVPVPLRPLVTSGMAKDPADRPADAAAFVSEPAHGRRGRLRPGLGAARPVGPGRGGPAAGRPVAVRRGACRGKAPPWSRSTCPDSPQESREARAHLWHLRHIRHEAHLRHLRHLRALMASRPQPRWGPSSRLSCDHRLLPFTLGRQRGKLTVSRAGSVGAV